MIQEYHVEMNKTLIYNLPDHSTPNSSLDIKKNANTNLKWLAVVDSGDDGCDDSGRLRKKGNKRTKRKLCKILVALCNSSRIIVRTKIRGFVNDIDIFCLI